MNNRVIVCCAVVGLLAACAETATGSMAGSAAGDVVVILAGDSMLGPGTADAATAARYYCSSRGKVAVLQARERPQEMQQPVLTEYALMTYRCTVPGN